MFIAMLILPVISAGMVIYACRCSNQRSRNMQERINKRIKDLHK